MSSTIGSPARITRSPGSWCGDALLGPEATIQNSAASWPSASSRSRTSRATSASVRPTSGPAAIAAITRSAAGPAAPQQRDLVGVLAHPQRAQHRRREREARARQHPLEPEHEGGAEPVGHGHRRDARAAGATERRLEGAPRRARIGSSVSSQVATSTAPARGRGAGPGRRRLEPRGDQRERRARPRPGTTSSVSRSSGMRLVAGEVAQVGAHADEQRVEARPRRRSLARGRRVARA